MRSCLVVLAFVGACAANTYTSNRAIDINALIQNDKEMRQFVDCFAGKSDCIAPAAAATKEFPDALSDSCAKCTSTQKHISKIFFAAFKEHYPTEYEDMRKNFDPENKLLSAFLTAVADS